MKKIIGVVLVMALAFGAGCGSDDDSDGRDQTNCEPGQTVNDVSGECVEDSDAGADASAPDAGASDAGSADSGAEDTGSEDAGSEDAGSSDAGGSADTGEGDVSQPDAGDVQTGTLYGVITREASPEEDGVGNLYIAVFDRDPIANQDTAQLEGFQLIEAADLAQETAEVAYRVEGITPRQEAYYITAFLDDDDTADTSSPESAGPDTGDLVAVESVFPPSSKTVTVDEPIEVELDIVLNFNMI